MTDDLHTDAPAADDALEEGTAGPVVEPPADAEADGPVDAGPTELPPRRLGIVAGVALAVLIADQASKFWAVNALERGNPVHLFWTFQWNLFDNTGVAFSLGSDSGLGPWISLLAIVVVIGVSLGATSRWPLGAVASGLISGGAVGNLLDRAFRGDDGFLHGAVVDFIDPGFWPVFNIADAAIVVGAILLVIASFRVPQ